MFMKEMNVKEVDKSEWRRWWEKCRWRRCVWMEEMSVGWRK